MIKALFKEGSLYTLSIILVKALNLALIPIYTRYLSPSDYGMIDILSVFGLFVAAIFTMQLNQGLLRFCSDQKNNLSQKIKTASSLLILYLVINVLLFVFLIINSQCVLELLSSNEKVDKLIFIVAIAYMLSNGLFIMLNSYLRAMDKIRISAYSFLLQGICSSIIVVVLILFYDLQVLGYFIGCFAGTVIGILFQAIILRRCLIFSVNFKALKPVLLFCLPLIPAALGHVTLNMTDRLFIKEFLDFSELGYFGVAHRFSTIISVFITGFSYVFAPLVYRNYLNANSKNEMLTVLKYFLSYGLIFVCMLSVFSKETLYVFVDARYYDAYAVMPCLYLTAMLNGLAIFAIGLKIKNKTSVYTLAYLSSACLNVVLNYVLISKYGLVGAAIATLLSTLLNNLVLLVASQRFYKLPYVYKDYLKLSFCFLLFSVIAVYLDSVELGMSLLIFAKVILILLLVYLMDRFKLIELSVLLVKIKNKLSYTGRD